MNSRFALAFLLFVALAATARGLVSKSNPQIHNACFLNAKYVCSSRGRRLLQRRLRDLHVPRPRQQEHGRVPQQVLRVQVPGI